MALYRRSKAARDGDNPILANPFEFGMSMVFVITSLWLVKQLLQLPPVYPHAGLMDYPLWFLWMIAAWVGTGGLFIFLGLVAWGSFKRMGRGFERAGLYLAGTGWLTVAWADWRTEHIAWGVWGIYLAIALSVGLRLTALRKLERAVKVANDTDAPDNGVGEE